MDVRVFFQIKTDGHDSFITNCAEECEAIFMYRRNKSGVLWSRHFYMLVGVILLGLIFFFLLRLFTRSFSRY